MLVLLLFTGECVLDLTETCVKDLLLCQSVSDLEMDRLCLCVALTALFCAASCGETGVSGAEVEQRVRPGDKVTLHCDCRVSSGVHVVWYRNCSHRNQPTLVMSEYNNNKNNMFLQYDQLLNPFPGFTLVWNKSNNTYDLLIENVTESDLGLYYCGTVALKVVETPPDKIKEEKLYLYGDITISLSFAEPPDPVCPVCPDPDGDCGLSWVLVLLSRALTALLLPCAYWVGYMQAGSWRRRREEVWKRSRDQTDQSFSMSLQ
ncbi:uncharacterized protein LOC124484109 isoform X2 [Hypomesus transpacificus]|uniref:uncharacterized protein LOC124484109 isoform X2 n=1 Tax=Hypomesus transpacificus TaxID=137520 RepID=UPI001F083F4A|nr:uncharacterized protein LOC124484109 isoform X2 [Hypomesus transpacificus]